MNVHSGMIKSLIQVRGETRWEHEDVGQNREPDITVPVSEAESAGKAVCCEEGLLHWFCFILLQSVMQALLNCWDTEQMFFNLFF